MNQGDDHLLDEIDAYGEEGTLYRGVIKIDLFRLAIPVFFNLRFMYQYFHEAGLTHLDPEEAEGADISATFYDNSTGVNMLGLFLKPGMENGISHWMHEISHLTDAIMDCVGLPDGMASTEIRARISEHLFSSIEDIMIDDFHEKGARNHDAVGTTYH